MHGPGGWAKPGPQGTRTASVKPLPMMCQRFPSHHWRVDAVPGARGSASGVALVQQEQAGQCQQVVDILDLLRVGDDEAGQAARRDDLAPLAELVIDAAEDRVDRARVPVDDARADRVDRVLA